MKQTHTKAQAEKAVPVKKTRQRPENKDDLDSRKNEEWQDKGDDVTHNRKEVHSERKMKKV